MKSLFRLVFTAAVAAGVVYWLREKMVPPPHVPEGNPPPFRTVHHTETETAPPPAATDAGDGDDLTKVKGIGPVYRDRLADAGIHSFADLATADAAALAETIDVAGTMIEEWQEQARSLG